MVTDLTSCYTSPAGKEFTLLAGRYAGITPASRVLDIGCGYGAGVTNMASEFRCRCTAVDTSEANLKIAQSRAEELRVSHLIEFVQNDIKEMDAPEDQYDLVLAEGGVLSLLGRDTGLDLSSAFLKQRGWLAFSDLVLLTEERKVPAEVLHIFDNSSFHYESEASYRQLLKNAGFEPHIISLVPPSGWDNYYAHMARRLEDSEGFFADRKVKELFHREIDVFYRLEGFRYIGYLFGLVRLDKVV